MTLFSGLGFGQSLLHLVEKRRKKIALYLKNVYHNYSYLF
jgi:hypothetical protein